MLSSHSEKVLVLDVVGVEALAHWISFDAFAFDEVEWLTRVFGLLLGTAGSSILHLRLVSRFIDVLFRAWCNLAQLLIEGLKRLEAISFLFLSL